MAYFDDWEEVKRGSWLYAGEVRCKVRILKGNIRYGSGDYEDPPEIRDDQEGEFYAIEYTSPAHTGGYKAGGGTCLSLEEAMQHVVIATHGTVDWDG